MRDHALPWTGGKEGGREEGKVDGGGRGRAGAGEVGGGAHACGRSVCASPCAMHRGRQRLTQAEAGVYLLPRL
jgi:hypothetical protein